VYVLKSDLKYFNRRYEKCDVEIIYQVSRELKAATTEERGEAGNVAIKERVKQAINKILGQSYVRQAFLIEVNHSIN
jgi:hypothetical protein